MSKANYEKIRDIINETVLYDNSVGSNGDIILTNNSANYDYIEIFFKTNDNVYNSVKVYNPNGKIIGLTSVFANYNTSEGMRTYIKTRIVKIIDDTITNVVANETVSASQTKITSSAVTIGVSNNIYITRVVGYKK